MIFMKWSDLNPSQFLTRKRQPGTTLLGLSLEGSTVSGVEIRRTNGSVELKRSFTAPLSLEVLTAEPELVGREIRKLLDAEGVRERLCIVGLPAGWVISLNVKLPELSDADAASFLELEAERGFPASVETLVVAQVRYRSAGGDSFATLLGLPRQHVARIESVLHAAQLRPVAFGLGITALPRAGGDGVTATLFTSSAGLDLQLACGAGIVSLRHVDAAAHPDAGEDSTNQLARDIRISLGQLPSDLRDSLRTLTVMGRGRAAEDLASALRPRLASLDLAVEHVRTYGVADFSVKLPSGTLISPELSLAVQYLAGPKPAIDFLPPKVSKWQQISARYSSQKLVVGGVTAGAVAVLAGLAFAVQQGQLMYWRSKWNGMKARVTELERLEHERKQFRPWFDDSVRSLAILRRLTESFPEDGTVSAKTVSLREQTGPQESPTVSCAGTARSSQALSQTIDRLRASNGVKDLLRGPIQGGTPLQFTFTFRWDEKGGR